MNRKCSTRKLFLEISQNSQENICVGISFLIKMQAFRSPALFKRDSNTDVFCEHWEIFRKPILKNICKRLLLKTSLELFPTWTNNIGYEEDIFSKIKQNKNRSKTQPYEKNLPFHDDHFVFLLLFTSVKVLKHLNQWATNPGPMENLCYLFIYTVRFVLITWISQLGSAVFPSVL